MIISEERLKQAILEYDDALMASLPDPSECDHVFSASFERKMKKLIRKADHFVAYKVMRYAASILIAFLLSASMFLAFNSEARATVVNWVKERFEGAYRYFFTAEDVESSVEYKLGWLPEGYELVDSFEDFMGKSFDYCDENGRRLYFAYSKGINALSFTTADGTYEEKHVVEEGLRVDLYISHEKNKANAITWISNNENIIFTISAYESEDALIKMAKGVKVD